MSTYPFLNCSTSEKVLLALLALGGPLPKERLSDRLEALDELGVLIVETEAGLTCLPGLAHPACRWAEDQGRLPALAESLRERLPDTVGVSPWQLRLELYAGGPVAPLLEKQPELRRCLAQACTEPFDAEWFERRPQEVRELAMECVMSDSVLRFRPVPEAYEYLRRSGPEHTLAEQLILRGRSRDAVLETPALLGLAELVYGRPANALERFGDRAPAGLPGLARVLALLGSGRMSEAAESINRGLNCRDPFTAVYRPLSWMLAASREGAPVVVRKLETAWEEPTGIGLERLICGLCLYWLDATRARETVGGLRRVKEQARACGYDWFARQTGSLLDRLRGDRREKAVLVDLLPPDQGGALTVQALLELIPRHEPRELSEGSRLAWLLESLGLDRYTVHPVLQKPVEGGWSKGARVSLKRLWEGNLDCLTGQDRRVCAHIVRRGTRYRLDADGALMELVDHPAVFWHDRPTTRVEIVREQAGVRLVQRGQERLLEAFPPDPPDRPLVCLPDGEHRLRLLELSPPYREIAKLLGEGVRPPRDCLPELLERLAGLVPIQADGVLETAVEEVEADARPHVQLRPSGSGFRLRMVVRPLGPGGPVLGPGTGSCTLLVTLDDRPRQGCRNLAGELERAGAVVEACPALSGLRAPVWETTLTGPGPSLEALEQLHELGDKVVLEWPEGQKLQILKARPDAMVLGLSGGSDLFHLDGELRVDEDLVIGLHHLLDLVATTKGRFLPLLPGQYLALTRQLQQQLETLNTLVDPKLRVHPMLAAELDDAVSGLGRFTPAPGWKERVARLRAAGPEPPPGLGTSLRSYQAEGYRWLTRLAALGHGACLADDMGLGKTVQTLAVLMLRADQGPSLVVAPRSVCMNWEDEVRRFTPGLRLRPYPGKVLPEELGPFDLVLTSYAMLHREREALARISWNTVVLDEAQAIKNPRSRRARAARALRADFRVATTGTPVENHLDELWSLFEFLNPGLLGTRQRFRKQFALPIERDGDGLATARLRALIGPFLLRRRREEVLQELPSLTEGVLKVDLTPFEASLYQSLRERALEELSTEDGVVRILAAITRMRLACCHAKLALPELPGVELSEDKIGSSKLSAFTELLEGVRKGGHRALVFSQFVRVLELVREVLDRNQVSYHLLTGSTPAEERRRVIEAFQAGEGEVFLISLKAGGTGLNLTGADYVIHLDPWWNPAVEDQASSRAHRLGQIRPVMVYRLVARGTIEERILELHQQKRALADWLLRGAEQSARMSAEELLSLIADPREPPPLAEADPEPVPADAELLELMARGSFMPEEQARAALDHRERAVATVLQAFEQGEELRWGACWLAGTLGDARLLQPLLQTLDREIASPIDSKLRDLTLAALARLGHPAVEPLLSRLVDVDSVDESWRVSVGEALVELVAVHPDCADAVGEGLLRALESPETLPVDRGNIMARLNDFDWTRGIPACERALRQGLTDPTCYNLKDLRKWQLDGAEPRRAPAGLSHLLQRSHRRLASEYTKAFLKARGKDIRFEWERQFAIDLADLIVPLLVEGRIPARAGRNDPCPCGTGRKYKKCCLRSDEEKNRLHGALLNLAARDWPGRGYAWLPSRQICELPQQEVLEHLRILCLDSSQLAGRVEEETNDYLLWAAAVRAFELDNTDLARSLAVLVSCSEQQHPALYYPEILVLANLPDRLSEPRDLFQLTLGTGNLVLAWLNVSHIAEQELERAEELCETLWRARPRTPWVVAPLTDIGLATVPELALGYVDRILADPPAEDALPGHPCPREALEGFRAELEEAVEQEARWRSLMEEGRSCPIPPPLRQE